MQNLEEVKQQAVEVSTSLIERSRQLEITDTGDLMAASSIMSVCKHEIKVIESAFKPHKDNAYKAHKDLCKAEAEQLAPFKEIGAILKPKMLEYRIAEAKREQEEKEEREAKQRQAEAEAKEALEKHFSKLIAPDVIDKAEALKLWPPYQPVASYVPEPEKVKVAGAGTRKIRKGRVLNFAKMADDFKQIDQKAVNKYASAMGENAKADGIEFYWETQLTGK